MQPLLHLLNSLQSAKTWLKLKLFSSIIPTDLTLCQKSHHIMQPFFKIINYFLNFHHPQLFGGANQLVVGMLTLSGETCMMDGDSRIVYFASLTSYHLCSPLWPDMNMLLTMMHPLVSPPASKTNTCPASGPHASAAVDNSRRWCHYRCCSNRLLE